MRIGNVGSISPAGELAAFAVAIAVVVSLSAFILPDRERDETNDIEVEDILLISSWIGIDPDGDGVVEIKENGVVISGDVPFPISGNIGIEIQFGDNRSKQLFQSREPLAQVPEHIISSNIHDFAVLVKVNGEVIPGSLSIYKWEGI